MDAWCQRYVGIPFKGKGRDLDGADCYGLVYVVYRDERGILLPKYDGDYASVADSQKIMAAFQAGCFDHPDWRVVAPTELEQTYDVIFFRIKGRPHHCAIIVKPGFMLHVIEKRNGSIERYNNPLWRPRQVGIYRYTSAA